MTARLRLGSAVSWAFERMGPTFLKVGQLLSLRPDIVGGEIAAQLARLRERARPVPFAAIEQQVEASLGRPVADVFSRLEAKPIGSGSLAQVHRGRLRSGEDVAVKVKKPGVATRVQRDLRRLRFLARWASRLGVAGSLPLESLAEELAAAIERQLDFRREADCQTRVAENFRDTTGIRVPTIVEGWLTDDVLIAELVSSPVPWGASSISPADREVVCRLGLRALYKMIFEDGLVHVDLHPGNLLLTAGPSLTLIDFGLAVRLSAAAQADFRAFFLSMAINDGDRCAELVLSTAEAVPVEFDREAFNERMRQHVASYSGLRARDFEVAGFAGGLFTIQREFGVRGSTEFVLVIVALLFFEGLIKQLAPDLDFQTESLPFLLSTGAGRGPEVQATRFAVEALAREIARQSSFSRSLSRAATPQS